MVLSYTPFYLLVYFTFSHFGKVFKAKDKKSSKHVAIKILPWTEDDEANEKLKQEICLMKDCHSPSIVEFYASYLKGCDLWVCIIIKISFFLYICIFFFFAYLTWLFYSYYEDCYGVL